MTEEQIRIKKQFQDAMWKLQSIEEEYLREEFLPIWSPRFIEAIEALPFTIKAELFVSDDKKIWLPFDAIEEPNWSKLTITQERGLKQRWDHLPRLRKLESRCKLCFYGLMGCISEDLSGAVQPSYQATSPMSEWTEETINIHYVWYNHFGS